MWNCTHFRHTTDEQLGHVYIFFSNYYNFQSVYFEFDFNIIEYNPVIILLYKAIYFVGIQDKNRLQ